MVERNAAIRLGVVGCGRVVSGTYLPILSRPEHGFRVVAVADIDPDLCHAVADRFGVSTRCASHAELLAVDGLDAVAVATPPGSHAAIGLDVLAAGKHLFMDKPLALGLEECDRLVAAAAGVPARVLMGFTSRWHRLVARARELLRSGALGPLRAVRSVYTHAHGGGDAQPWHRTRAQGGGVLFNDGGHHFDLWRYLLDTEIVQVQADAIDSQDFENDTCTVSARLENGMLASALFSFSTGPTSEVEIFGERGSLLLNLYRFDGLRFMPHDALPGDLRARRAALTNFVGALPAGLASMRRGGDFDACFVSMWRHFADCIRTDARPLCELVDGRAAVAAQLAAQASIDTGRAVAVS